MTTLSGFILYIWKSESDLNFTEFSVKNNLFYPAVEFLLPM